MDAPELDFKHIATGRTGGDGKYTLQPARGGKKSATTPNVMSIHKTRPDVDQDEGDGRRRTQNNSHFILQKHDLLNPSSKSFGDYTIKGNKST